MRKQCPEVYSTKSGAVFCTKDAGHEGEHRGYRKRWVGKAPGKMHPVAAIILELSKKGELP